jgi:hypothetical protein
MLSFLIEIDYGTHAGKLASASATVNARDYEEAYALVRERVVSTRRPARMIGGRSIGRAYPTDAVNPGIVAAKLEVEA